MKTTLCLESFRPLRFASLISILVLPFASGCVTINVYLPTKDIQDAAAEIVDEVRPVIEPNGSAGESNGEESNGDASSRLSPELGPSRLALVAFALGAVDEDDEKKNKKKLRLNISTPKIKAIKKTLLARYKKLYPFYSKKVVGEGRDGYLSVRTEKGLGLKEKRDLKLLVKKENDDRKQLYTELAVANKIDKKEIPTIGKLFSVEWQRKSKVGWWIQEPKGKWVAKKPPPKKKPKKSPARA